MGCISSAPKTDPSETNTNNPLARKLTFVVSDGSVAPLKKKVTIKHGAPLEEGDISLIKNGENLVILGTKVVVDIRTCNVVGFLNDASELVRETSDEIVEVCKKYELVFSA